MPEEQAPAFPTTPGGDVFISYASQDKAMAEAVCKALESAGLICWIAPRDVDAGALYAEAIVRAIGGAKAFVLVLSAHAIASSHVGKEVERASSKTRPIFALRIDTAPLTPALEYFLSESQWIEVQAGNIEPAYAKLINAVRKSAPTPTGVTAAVTPLAAALSVAQLEVPRKRILLVAVLATLALALAVLGVYRFWVAKRPTAEQSATSVAAIANDKSIAVLPFEDMSEKKDQGYFADGMAEEIIDLLTKVPGIVVIGRTSSFQFKGTNLDLRTIGRKLGAAYLLEGSVRRSSDRVRLTAQLIDSQTGAHRWSETYDRPAGDALKVQDDIAAGLARALEVSVGADLERSPRGSPNNEAYDLYLRGRIASDRGDIEGMETSNAYLHRALDIDPKFTDAAEALASNYYWQANSGQIPSREGYEQARLAAETVVRRDPARAWAHAILGGVHSDYDRDWAGADGEFKKALDLSPHDGGILLLTAQLPVTLGQLDVARRIYQQALAYDPLSANTYFFLSWVEFRAGRWGEAEAAARKAVDIAPAMVWGHAQVSFALLMRGNREAALAEASRDTDPMIRQQAMAIALYALGRKADSDSALKALISDGADREAFQIASVYGYRAERDEALKWLERAYEQRDPNLFFIKWNPFLKTLESDSRYKAFLKKLKLPD
jgi:TolB-like protein